jgi:hypothetical protein
MNDELKIDNDAAPRHCDAGSNPATREYRMAATKTLFLPYFLNKTTLVAKAITTLF